MTKIIVKIAGGCVQEIIHNIEDLDIVVLDADFEDVDELVETVKEFEGERYYGYVGEVGVFSPERIEEFEKYVNPHKREYKIQISEAGGTHTEVIKGDRLLVEDNTGSECEFIYALQEEIGMVEALSVGEAEYFQPNRDDKTSKGIILRIK